MSHNGALELLRGSTHLSITVKSNVTGNVISALLVVLNQLTANHLMAYCLCCMNEKSNNHDDNNNNESMFIMRL